MSERILYEVENAVATITLNRPEALNAMDGEMMRSLRAACESAESDSAVRAVVLRGAGPAFLAGGDVKLFHANLEKLPSLIISLGRELNHAVMALRRMAKPVVAAVQGACAGAGVSLVAAADLALAASDARFNMAYSRIATNPDGGATFFLPRLMGMKRAMELTLLADTVEAEAARELGLVNWVVPAAELEARSTELAQRLAGGPSYAYGQAKALINQAFGTALEVQLEAEIQAFARCAHTADLAEGVRAFVEKRKPQFRGR